MLSKLARQEQSNGSLDFPTGHCRTLVVVSKTCSFSGDSLENVVDERIHDAHGFARDSSVRMYLLKHLVDVDAVAFPASLSSFLLVLVLSLRIFNALFTSFRGDHDEDD